MALKSKYTKNTFPIIALGGSAGSFHAFEDFFMHMPVNSGMAFVIVMHLDPLHHVDVSGLLQNSTTMPIVEAEDGMLIMADHVYVIPPGQDMGIHNRKLLLLKASRAKGAQMSIDYFLQSLSEDQGSHAVAIIFSGMGADGESGVRIIKEKLGMVMVQKPESAEFSSMPLASIKTNMVDYVLEPDEMPLKIVQYLSHPVLNNVGDGNMISERNNHNQFQKILMMLRSHTGHDFTLYKKNTIIRRMERRIAFLQLPDYQSYVNYLREHPEEINLLFNELLIGVTKFFRDSAAFDSIRAHFYAILKTKSNNDFVRIWIAGCSTGEEAYSIAILVLEYLDTLKPNQKPKVQIFATDLDANAIENARSGFYFGNIAAEVSPERLERFFVKKGEGYIVKKEVREVIVFAQHNLIKDAPFTRLDLICCRNVMIYLTAELQKKIIPVFHYSLRTGGLLFLGPAESLGMFGDVFNVLDSKWKIFEKKEGPAVVGKMLDFPFDISNQSNKLSKQDFHHKINQRSPIAETFNKLILDNYSPPSLLLTSKGEILYINGKVSDFLQITPGEAVMNIHRMVREELKYVLGNALYQASDQKKRIEISNLKLKLSAKMHLINIVVDLLNEGPLQDFLLVTFMDKGPLKKISSVNKSVDFIKNSEVEELEKELVYTKQQLHTTIEQMETSLEELKSTNEELQSTNEELQSTNEEALTTKEEMQSLNEELMTINLQYHNKAEESTQLNNDMKNLLDSTEIGTIFLDNELNILRFTPQVTKLFNVIPSDVGRSITHIVSNFDYHGMENTIREVIEKLSAKEIEVKTKLEDWYNLRIMPYRTMDNFISGAVLTFSKITPVKGMQRKLHTLTSFVQVMVDALPDATLVLDKDLKVVIVNHRFFTLFQMHALDVKDQSFKKVLHEHFKTNKLDQLLLNTIHQVDEILIEHEYPGIGLKTFLVTLKPLATKDSMDDVALVLTFKDQNIEEVE